VKILLKSAYGSVRPYTRHGVECPHASDPGHDTCHCPKWIYVWNKLTGQKTRKSLTTPSWAEAQRIAADTLRGMDPEIAAARAVNGKQEEQRMTVADACDLWIERSKRLSGEDGSTVVQYVTLKKKICAWAQSHGITHIEDVTSLQLERWYSSREWTNLAATTKSQRWGCLRSMFKFFEDRGILEKSPAAGIKATKLEATHVQGPYSAEQVKKILASVEASIPVNLPIHKRASYGPRLRAFILFLLNTGADVSDAILFEPARLETHRVGKKTVTVFRYARIKTDVGAVIPLPADVVSALKSIPLEPGCSEDMPFRTKGLLLKQDQKKWSNRIHEVLDAAKVEFVELPTKDRHGRPQLKAANAKMLRHTFAVGQLKAGQRPEEVAKMLGHVDTTMVRLHYAPWCKALDDAHITRVVSGW
jgi:site-specific recombinase XerD